MFHIWLKIIKEYAEYPEECAYHEISGEICTLVVSVMTTNCYITKYNV